MRVYRVEYTDGQGESKGFCHFARLGHAEDVMERYESHAGKDTAKLEVLDIELTEIGVLTALNRYAGHPDNG